MKAELKLAHTIFLVLLFNIINAQSKSPVKYGDVSAKDFDITNLKVDTIKGAIIISDVVYQIGKSGFRS